MAITMSSKTFREISQSFDTDYLKAAYELKLKEDLYKRQVSDAMGMPWPAADPDFKRFAQLLMEDE